MGEEEIRDHFLLMKKSDSTTICTRDYSDEAGEDCTSTKWTKEEAIEEAKRLVTRAPSARFTVLKAVVTIGVPIEIIEL